MFEKAALDISHLRHSPNGGRIEVPELSVEPSWTRWGIPPARLSA